jgi:hypothetical protein
VETLAWYSRPRSRQHHPKEHSLSGREQEKR